MRLSPRDLYRLRKAHLYAEGRTLKTKMAHHNLQLLVLELERRYGLLGIEATLNIHTGVISRLAVQDGETGNTPPQLSDTPGMKESQNGPD